MKKRFVFFVLILLMFMAFSYNIAYTGEDQEQETSTVTLTILPACQLTINDQEVSKTLVKDSTAESAFETGYVEFEPYKPTFIVSSNKQWKLTARTSGFTGPYDKIAGDLQLKNLSAEHAKMADYTSLSSQDQEVAAHPSGAKSEEHPCQYRILLDWDKDVPGTYEATVIYTLSTTGA